MSAELETLDQLLVGVLSLAVIRNLYPDGESFRQGVFGLLSSGDVCLLMVDQTIVPSWRWRELFVAGTVMNDLGNLNLKITEQGAHRILQAAGLASLSGYRTNQDLRSPVIGAGSGGLTPGQLTVRE